MFFISFRKHRNVKKGKQLVYLDNRNANTFTRATITSTARASSVSTGSRKYDFKPISAPFSIYLEEN